MCNPGKDSYFQVVRVSLDQAGKVDVPCNPPPDDRMMQGHPEPRLCLSYVITRMRRLAHVLNAKVFVSFEKMMLPSCATTRGLQQWSRRTVS
jgi:hypothetical protein